jgi:hypothetical protein
MSGAAGPLLLAVGLWRALAASPDCGDEARQRQVLVQARAFELHAVEEQLRVSLAEALQACPAGPGGAVCRTGAQLRSQVERQRHRGEIDARYERLLRELEDRCRATSA